jgi:hypothetical protein
MMKLSGYNGVRRDGGIKRRPFRGIEIRRRRMNVDD